MSCGVSPLRQMVDGGHERVVLQLQALGAGEGSSSAGADSPGSDQKSRGMARYVRSNARNGGRLDGEMTDIEGHEYRRKAGDMARSRQSRDDFCVARTKGDAFIRFPSQTNVAEPQLSDAARQSNSITIKVSFSHNHQHRRIQILISSSPRPIPTHLQCLVLPPVNLHLFCRKARHLSFQHLLTTLQAPWSSATLLSKPSSVKSTKRMAVSTSLKILMTRPA